MRYGLNAKIVEPETGEIITISEQLRRLIELTAQKAKELHAEQHLDYARTMLEQGSETDLQRALYKDLNGDLRALEKELARRTLEFSV
jgi:gamma-glutamyl:cysteine ligase YbdK (ATP-grasp superfamily)